MEGVAIADTLREEKARNLAGVAWSCMDMEAVTSGARAAGPYSIGIHREALPGDGDVRRAGPRCCL